MYWRQIGEKEYICSEGATGIPIRMLVCPHCIKILKDSPEKCFFKYIGIGEEIIKEINPLTQNINEEDGPESVEYIEVKCPHCEDIFRFAIEDVYLKNYFSIAQYEVSAIKYNYLEKILKDANIPEDQIFLFIRRSVEEYLKKMKG